MPAIPEEAVVSINISGAFHRRILGMYFNYAKKFDPQKFDELVKAVSTNNVGSLKDVQDQIDAFTIETMLILMNGLETEFRNKNLLTETEMDVPSED